MTNSIRAALMGALMMVPLAGPALAMEEMASPHQASMMATMACRPAGADEKANATTTDDRKLVCKSIAGMMKHEPVMKPGMTAKQMQQSWQRFFGNVFAVSPYEK